MATFLSGLRTLTFTVTDPEVGDTISFSVYLTTTNSATATPAYTGGSTPSQTTTTSTAGTPLTFAPTVNVGATGNYYAWVVMTLTNSAGVTTTTVYAQAQLTIGSIAVTVGTWS
jgi:hypothetical protein